jgi:hypothetical protein
LIKNEKKINEIKLNVEKDKKSEIELKEEIIFQNTKESNDMGNDIDNKIFNLDETKTNSLYCL